MEYNSPAPPCGQDLGAALPRVGAGRGSVSPEEQNLTQVQHKDGEQGWDVQPGRAKGMQQPLQLAEVESLLGAHSPATGRTSHSQAGHCVLPASQFLQAPGRCMLPRKKELHASSCPSWEARVPGQYWRSLQRCCSATIASRGGQPQPLRQQGNLVLAALPNLQRRASPWGRAGRPGARSGGAGGSLRATTRLSACPANLLPTEGTCSTSCKSPAGPQSSRTRTCQASHNGVAVPARDGEQGASSALPSCGLWTQGLTLQKHHPEQTPTGLAGAPSNLPFPHCDQRPPAQDLP